MADWESQIAGERMAVDGEFSDRIGASSLSSQQWDLVMTAVQFDIENPGTPADATLVADTSRLDMVMEDVQRVGNRSPVGSDDAPRQRSDSFLGGVLSTLGIGDSTGDDLRDEAAELAERYAQRLQAKLVENGRWSTICERVASG